MREIYSITFTDTNNRKHTYVAELFKSERDEVQKLLQEADGVEMWDIEKADVIRIDELQEALREDIP